MKRKTFFNPFNPIIAGIIGGKTIEELDAKARKCEMQGADALALQIELLPLECRTEEKFGHLVKLTQLPCMFICYRCDSVYGADDEKRQESLLTAAAAGAEVIDVMGDLFDPSDFELTRSPEAIEKQKRLIDKIHGLGAKVVMSSHMSSSPRTAEQVLEHLQRQSERGADILKIVTAMETAEQLTEAIRTTMLLHEKLDKPFIHLGNGAFSRIHRYIGLKLGASITFATDDYYPSLIYGQPSIASMRAVVDNLHWGLPDILR